MIKIVKRVIGLSVIAIKIIHIVENLLKDVNIIKDQKVTENMDIMKTLENILTEEKKSLEITY